MTDSVASISFNFCTSYNQHQELSMDNLNMGRANFDTTNISEADLERLRENFEFFNNLQLQLISQSESRHARADSTLLYKMRKKICWSCHASAADLGTKLFKCSSCRKARYCDTECQEDDWGRHKEFCGQVHEIRRQRQLAQGGDS